VLDDYRGWLDRIDAKNRQPGTSAPTLALAWSGPLDLLGALGTVPELADLSVESVTAEAKATFDTHGGNVRNHDLVLRAATAAGGSVVVCVEAKAGEDLGDQVRKQRIRAEKALADNPRSNAVQRLDDLLSRLCRYPPDDARTQALQYQLLTAWAGTVADADGCDHAVLALHEFRTNERPEGKTAHNRESLDRFADAVLRCELPERAPPWCLRIPDIDGVQAKLYLAHVVTDLRGARVRGS
jgi:Domain of unknown function (DUF6946)